MFFFQAEDGIRDLTVTGVQTCALPILHIQAVVLTRCILLQSKGVVNTSRRFLLMTFLQICVLFVAGILGGTLNSVAGGGSFITFPILLFTGVPPINANATSTVALWPGSVASTGAYREELAKQERIRLFVLGGTSLIGGVLGAILLLRTSQTTFVRLVPYLLLVATLLFAFSGPITNRLRRRNLGTKQTGTSWSGLVGIAFLQLIISGYGGYSFGGLSN